MLRSLQLLAAGRRDGRAAGTVRLRRSETFIVPPPLAAFLFLPPSRAFFIFSPLLSSFPFSPFFLPLPCFLYALSS